MKKVVFTSLLIICLSFILFKVSGSLELKLFDLKTVLLSKTIQTDIAMVFIDQKSLDFYQENFDLSWPWPRQFYGKMIKFLSSAGAKAIVLDMIFSEDSIWGKNSDPELAQAMQESGRVFLPVFFSEGFKKKKIDLKKFSLEIDSDFDLTERKGVTTPIQVLLKQVKGIGYATGEPDNDGVYRRTSLICRYENNIYPSLSLSLALALDKTLQIKSIPYNKSGEVLIKNYRPAGFKTYSIRDLIQSQVRLEEKKTSLIEKNQFKDKIVFIGGTALGLLDLRPTPLDPKTPGVMIHANSFLNIFLRDFLVEVNPLLEWVLILIFVFGFQLILTRQKSLVKIILVSTSVLIIIVFINFLFFYLNTVLRLLPFLLAYILVFFFTYLKQWKEKRFVSRAFKNYLSDSLLQELLQNPEQLKLGGENKNLTVLFSDLAGFTSLAEKMSPEEVVNLLNLYFNNMTDIVIKHNGYVDKFLGDAIMAFWGAPVDLKNHEAAAVKTALECQETLTLINKNLKEKGLLELSMRIGICTGEMIVGNIGSNQRFEYTVIGDSVNLASRLEGLNKFYNTRIICSESCKIKTVNDFIFRRLDRVRVKGKDKPVQIYEVIGEKNLIDPEISSNLKTYETGMDNYFSGNFKEAVRAFEKLRTDPVSLIFYDRCKEFIKDPPGNWQGIRTFSSK